MTGEYVIQLLAFANPDVDVSTPMGELAASHLGRFLVHYDLDAPTPETMIVTTADPAQAKGFRDTRDAFACWRLVRGTRRDGRPNRPLTAYSVSIGLRPR